MTEELDHLKLKGGILDGVAIDAKQAEDLSKMPGRQELQAGVIGLALGPGNMVIKAVKGPGASVLGAIDKHIENLEDGA